ncbi:hypothetical protein AAZX31_15G124800 [Glycine max]
MASALHNTTGGSPPPPPPLQPLVVSSSLASFSHSISEKLTTSNYLLWCSQVQPVVKGHGLSHFLVAPIIPLRFLTIADRDAGIVSPEYLSWKKQDQLLLS